MTHKINNWNAMSEWCENKGFAWTIINNHFYWVTNIQTGEMTDGNHIIWHEHEYFHKLIHGDNYYYYVVFYESNFKFPHPFLYRQDADNFIAQYNLKAYITIDKLEKN